MDSAGKPIYVTQPALPPLEEFTDYLRKIWDNKILTNNGPFLKQFERELAAYLGVKYISVVANGTLALLIAQQVLRITGEVITTPFSFVATTHSLRWNNITPVFADVEPEYLNLDPEKVEKAITKRTTAIMPVHVYGNPCLIDRFQRLADKYGLKLIYDGAHAFGVKIEGNSVLNCGDLSILSFHATKVFNTFEGGAIICHSEEMKYHIDNLKNFGFRSETIVEEPGINAKMNEIQAVFGMIQLKHIEDYITRRKVIAEYYDEQLERIEGIRVLKQMKGVKYSFTYFPVFIDSQKYGKTRDTVYEELKAQGIYTRRYFYPLISRFPSYAGLHSSEPENLPVAEKAAAEVLCLPIYPGLALEQVKDICFRLRNGM
jgi:dTDP-4-amino-4,6-dideoxygalactose transaminase